MQRWANRLVYGDRASPHDVLSQVTARLSDAPGSAGIDDLARLLAEGTGADQAVVWMRSGEIAPSRGDVVTRRARVWRAVDDPSVWAR